MKKIELTFGIRGRDKKIYSTPELNDFIETYMMSVFDNMTIVNGTGIWKQQIEPIFIVTIYLPLDHKYNLTIEHICSEYCRLFDQECVLCIEHDIEYFELISEKRKLQQHDKFTSLIDKKEYYVREIENDKILITMITHNPMEEDPHLGAAFEWMHGSNYVII